MAALVPVVEKLERKPGQWGETALGILPFVLFGLSAIFYVAPVGVSELNVVMVLGAIFSLGGYLVILYGLLRGWLLGFPRWVYPYLVYAIFFTFFLSNASTPGLKIFGIPLFGGELWGWRAYVPLGIVALLALITSRPPWGSLVRLGKGIWNDWTRLSFGLYGLMILATMISMDEVERSFRFPPTLLAVIMVILGALGYMRLERTWQRLASLLVCAVLSTGILLACGDYFWQTHIMNFSTGESRVLDVAVDLSRLTGRVALGAGIALLVLLVPLPVGLLRWLWRRFAPRLLKRITADDRG